MATDCSPGALLEAKNNSMRLGVDIAFKLGDWWDALNSDEDGPFDLIITNPPYVGIEKNNGENTLSGYEPPISLYGKEPSESGTNDAMKIISGVSDWLEDGGRLVIEHGFNQRKILSDFAISEDFLCWNKLMIYQVYQGIDVGKVNQNGGELIWKQAILLKMLLPVIR